MHSSGQSSLSCGAVTVVVPGVKRWGRLVISHLALELGFPAGHDSPCVSVWASRLWGGWPPEMQKMPCTKGIPQPQTVSPSPRVLPIQTVHILATDSTSGFWQNLGYSLLGNNSASMSLHPHRLSPPFLLLSFAGLLWCEWCNNTSWCWPMQRHHPAPYRHSCTQKQYPDYHSLFLLLSIKNPFNMALRTIGEF